MAGATGDEGRHVRSLDELEDRLRDQFEFLTTSAKAFDSGKVNEAFRLATTVRVLCYDTSRTSGGRRSRPSRSLLHLLGLLPDKLRFMDSTHNHRLPPGAFVIDFGPSAVRMDFDAGNVRPHAYLDDLPPECINPPAPFERWWSTPFVTNVTPLSTPRSVFTYSRGNVVRNLANKDGGTHVDPDVPRDHQAFIDHDGGIEFQVNGRPARIVRYALAAVWMRQIAHEVQRTLQRDFRTEAILQGRPSGLA
jgi:hypothetical protein